VKQSSKTSSGGDALYYSLKASKSESDDTTNNILSRRGFLHGTTISVSAITAGLSLGATGATRQASAVDFPQVPDVSRLTNGSGKQRIGGLANKIRNSCRVMVRKYIIMESCLQQKCSMILWSNVARCVPKIV